MLIDLINVTNLILGKGKTLPVRKWTLSYKNGQRNLAWWAMSSWLQHFAYRVPLNAWVFIIAGGAALLIALITVSFQAVKAALANPVNSLQAE